MNNVVDSSAWLEYLGGSKNGQKYAPIIKNTDWLIIPSIVIFEVYKKLLTYSDEKFFNATLWTQDCDFKNIEGVKYFPKK